MWNDQEVLLPWGSRFPRFWDVLSPKFWRVIGLKSGDVNFEGMMHVGVVVGVAVTEGEHEFPPSWKIGEEKRV